MLGRPIASPGLPEAAIADTLLLIRAWHPSALSLQHGQFIAIQRKRNESASTALSQAYACLIRLPTPGMKVIGNPEDSGTRLVRPEHRYGATSPFGAKPVHLLVSLRVPFTSWEALRYGIGRGVSVQWAAVADLSGDDRQEIGGDCELCRRAIRLRCC